MNDKLRKCPRCGKGCNTHLEFIVANKLAQIGTGALNIDIPARYTWTASLGKRGELCGRTAFIELKMPAEEISAGLTNTYRDITGTLTTSSGIVFEQRGFILENIGNDSWRLWTWKHPYTHGAGITLDQAVTAIQDWIVYGALPETMAQGPAA